MKNIFSAHRRCLFCPNERTSLSLTVCGLSIAAAMTCHGGVLVQELFDGIDGPPPGSGSTLNGKGDTATTIGLTGTWVTNGGEGIYTASNFNTGTGYPGPGSSNGVLGGVWNRTNSYNRDIYATRPLATTIDFSLSQTIYFSVYLANPGDTSMGIGLASGAGGSSEFVGSGLSWNNASQIGGTTGSANNTSYISYGNLDTADGVYGIRASDSPGSVNGSSFLVGRLTINEFGNDLIDIATYGTGDTIESDPSLVTWSASGSYDSVMMASHLVIWMNGGSFGGGELDGIRMGTTWADVTVIPEPGSMTMGALGFAIILRRRRR